MKKAKITLLTTAILAMVGTALAFKVQNYGSDTYCYAITSLQPSAIDCDRVTQNKTVRPFMIGTKIYYTATSSLENCTLLSCPNIGELPFNN